MLSGKSGCLFLMLCFLCPSLTILGKEILISDNVVTRKNLT